MKMRRIFKRITTVLTMIMTAAATATGVSAADKVYGSGEMNDAGISTLLSDVNSVIMLPIIVILTVVLQVLIIKKVTHLKNVNFICLVSSIATLGSYIVSVIFSLVVFKLSGGSFGIFQLGASGMFNVFSASNLLICLLVTVPVLYYGLKNSYRSKRRHEISVKHHQTHHHHADDGDAKPAADAAVKEVKEVKTKSLFVQSLTKYKKLKLAILYSVIATAALDFVIQFLLDLVKKG